MEFEHPNLSSSSSSSSLSSGGDVTSPSGVNNIDINKISSFSSATGPNPSPKRKAGRKKFRETRHPVYHGVRERKGNKWVCEVREPQKKTRIWLGTYTSPEMAARAHDVAAIALRGSSAVLNFPGSSLALPRAVSTSPGDIRAAASKAVKMCNFECSSGSICHPGETKMFRSESLLVERIEGMDGRTVDGVIDEDEVFNMPLVLEEMASGLMLSPPSMVRFESSSCWPESWDGMESCHVDWTLWNLD